MIIIDEKYRIGSNGTGWTVEEYKGKITRKDKDKNLVEYEHWDALTYHSRVEGALDSVLNMKMKDLPTMKLEEFLNESRKIKSELTKLLHIGG